MKPPIRIALGAALFLLSVSLYRFSFAMGYTIFHSAPALFVFLIPACNALFSVASLLLAAGYKKKWKWIGFGAGLVPLLLASPLMLNGSVNPVYELGVLSQNIVPATGLGRPVLPPPPSGARFSSFASLWNAIRGRLAGLAGDREGKIKAYTAAIEAGSPSAVAYSNRAFAYYQAGKMEEALADAQSAIQIDPRFSRSYRVRGIVRESYGDLDGAIRDYYKALRLEPRYAKAAASLKKANSQYKNLHGKQAILWLDAPLDPMTREQAEAAADRLTRGKPLEGYTRTIIENEAKYVDPSKLRAHRYWSVRWESADGRKPIEFILDRDSHEPIANTEIKQ